MRTFVTTDIAGVGSLDFEPTLVFGYYTFTHQAAFAAQCETLLKQFPSVDIIGCSTESVITNECPYIDRASRHQSVFIFMDLKREGYTLNVFFDRSYESVGVACDPQKRYAALLLSTHHNHLENYSVLNKIRTELGIQKTFGALASNAALDIRSNKVSLYHNGRFKVKGYILLLIDEAFYDVKGESLGSFEPIGFEMNITKTHQNTILEIEGKPALEMIEEIIGEMSEYGVTHYAYPFYVWNPKKVPCPEAMPLRTLLTIDREEKSLHFFNHIEEGCKIRPAIRIKEEEERRKLTQTHDKMRRDSFIFLFVCIAFKEFWKDFEHVYLMQFVNDTHVSLGGFHTFGEIGYEAAFKGCSILNNQTVTYVAISEKEE